ncbi:MAG: excinuclease ABC subunit UvrB [Christensenellaceae bacterium]|jgi:excinuclease ABC subunit B|nr:excinuclease ABC subunit UvrB [Christensenellaceae bacterium]
MSQKFLLKSKYNPCGDQPQAIAKLVDGINSGHRLQVLLGVTGSGKTFTMANIINKLNRPALIIAHNKTLAAQLCNEFRELFPDNRVEYFVSYYDYFQPEAYIPRSDTYIEKEIAINDEIDKLRHSATSSLGERQDVIIVSSVSCIYGLGAPVEYFKSVVSIRPNDIIDRDELIDKLVEIHYKRNDIDFARSTFRVRGDSVEIFPANNTTTAIRCEFFGNVIERIVEYDVDSRKLISELEHVAIFPASHYILGDLRDKAIEQINNDLTERIEYFRSHGKLIEAQRIKERVGYDVEMITEMGYVNGVENYSRYFDGRAPGTAPFTLMDYFPDDYITFIDESHITLPQIRGMYNGDRARKRNLVEFGFRLPAAFDNRPLNFDEFNKRVKQVICVSATPAEYELQNALQVVEQVVRPTGLLEPPISIRSTDGQIDDLISEINRATDSGGRVLVTTLTKRMAESLTSYLKEHKIKVEYMHSDIDTLDRIEIINKLRLGDIDVIVGINLLREGLDIPEVLLVAILDADKEGFLRSKSSLIQTVGRAARNKDAQVIFYADSITGSMRDAIEETNRRRNKQVEYNKTNGITPTTIIKPVRNTLIISKKPKTEMQFDTKRGITEEIERLMEKMMFASKNYDFETAILLRDEIRELKRKRDKIADEQ